MRDQSPAASAPSPSASQLEKRINALLKGNVVHEVTVHNSRELVIFFESGARLFVNASTDLEFSVT